MDLRGHNKRIFWATAVVMLVFGALSPVFRSNRVADYVGFVSSILLGGALLWFVLRAKTCPEAALALLKVRSPLAADTQPPPLTDLRTF